MPYTNWTVSSVLSGLFSLRLVNWSYICCSCFNAWSDFSGWFVKGFVCTQGGVGVSWLTQTHAERSDVVSRPAFHLTFMFSVPGRKTNYTTALNKHGKHNTKPHATCKTASALHGTVHTHSITRQLAEQRCRFRSVEPLVASWPGFVHDLDLTWTILLFRILSFMHCVIQLFVNVKGMQSFKDQSKAIVS